jgi:hypothetical protein
MSLTPVCLGLLGDAEAEQFEDILSLSDIFSPLIDSGGNLLLETGDDLLLETGDKLLLEAD